MRECVGEAGSGVTEDAASDFTTNIAKKSIETLFAKLNTLRRKRL